MRFAWTDDQLAFAAATRDLLASECPPSAVRGAASAPPGALDRGVWDLLAAQGVTGLLAAEAEGRAGPAGLGLDECFAVPVLEEAGRAALPHPLVDTVCVGAPLGVGGMVATDLGGPLVGCAADADALVLSGPGGSLVRLDAGAVTVEPVATTDPARRAGRVRWAPGDAEPLTDDPAAVALAFDRGALGTAAQLCGLAQAMLDVTVAYVGERRQFGVPVGSFQAVKHRLADALLALDFARPAVARAAWTLAQPARTGPGPAGGAGAVLRARDVSMAKALATDAADACGRAALQCHGAIGYTVEHDLHLFLKRSWALARTWGDRAAHAERVGRALDALAAPDVGATPDLGAAPETPGAAPPVPPAVPRPEPVPRRT